MASEFFQEVERAQGLPSVPGVALRILDLLQADDVDTQELADTIGRDPALAARVLKTANSALFGARGQISSVPRAITVLGLRTVSLLALSFSLMTRNEKPDHGGFDFKRFWRMSAIATLVSRQLATRVAPELRDSAFLAGLLCDLGQLAAAQGARARYAEVLTRLEGSTETLQAVERDVLGTDHMEFGCELLRSWGLPRLICQAVGAHHDPSRVADPRDPARMLAQILHVATTCAELYGGGDLEPAAIAIKGLSAQYSNLESEACAELLREIEADLPHAAELFEVEIPDARALAEICTRASQLVVKETLALNQQVQDATAQARHFERKASIDALTGLPNRGFLDERLGAELDKARGERVPLGLLMMDLDRFKNVNDRFGHAVGDELLRAVGRCVLDTLSAEEWSARYGGEEIVCVLPGCTRAQVEGRAEQLRGAIEAIDLSSGGERVPSSVSVGACWLERVAEGVTDAQLIDAADRELYRAKSAGRNRVSLATAIAG
ncbi:MAG: HDOD domain-containing protein [Myxococcota bacterium]